MPKKTKIKLTILKGRDLAAKDRNLLGQMTTSDPYVEIWANNEIQGKTKTIEKTLNPEWNETFTFKLKGDHPSVALKLFDANLIQSPDPMGVVTLAIPTKKKTSTKWHEIPKDSANDASGSIKIKLETTKMKQKPPKDSKSSKPPSKSSLKGPKPPKSEPPFKIHDCRTDKQRKASEEQQGIWDTIAKKEKEITDLKRKLKKSQPYRDHKNTRNSLFEVHDYFKSENLKLLASNSELKAEINEIDPSVIGTEKILVEMTILKGRDLVAKDRNIVGKLTTSDPFVEVYIGNNLVGKTRVIPRTLEPFWNEQFNMVLKRDHSLVILKIWDEDTIRIEPMGQLKVQVPPPSVDPVTQWVDVMKESASKASGQIKLKFEVRNLEDPRWKLLDLEEEANRLKTVLDEVDKIAKPLDSENSLRHTVDYLQGTNKELIKENAKLHSLKEEN